MGQRFPTTDWLRRDNKTNQVFILSLINQRLLKFVLVLLIIKLYFESFVWFREICSSFAEFCKVIMIVSILWIALLLCTPHGVKSVCETFSKVCSVSVGQRLPVSPGSTYALIPADEEFYFSFTVSTIVVNLIVQFTLNRLFSLFSYRWLSNQHSLTCLSCLVASGCMQLWIASPPEPISILPTLSLVKKIFSQL